MDNQTNEPNTIPTDTPRRGYGPLEAVVFGLPAALGVLSLHALALTHWPDYAAAPGLLHVAAAVAAMWALHVAGVLAVHALDQWAARWTGRRLGRLFQRLADSARAGE